MTNEMTRTGEGGKIFFAAVVMIAATYGYFLIFAQFAFLELLTEAVGADGLRGAMGAMGAGGVAGSLLAAWRFRAEGYVWALRVKRSAAGILRATASNKPKAKSATSSFSTSGVCVTMMPRFLAAATSIPS